ncbi:alpha/beta-hydrolase [Daedalea quercina L-15889]|uniref:Alpha/beta-hydrolase n=1 Tax=Daedalea quercina L-15889 TaxID=1314783 RepID=A0A165QFE6_9APHY|nr:alpha/beta-hydrolase [Daedalea quercina L-15889]
MPFKPVVKTLRSADGTLIHAEFVGDVQKPCVVFVHGLNMSSVVFDDLFCDRSLLREVCMARYDLRGHGRSGMPEDAEAYKSSTYAEDFAAVMRDFGLRRPTLVTWSYGGTVSCDIYASLSSDLIEGIVYVAAVPYLGPPMFPGGVTQLTAALLETQMHPADVAAYFMAKTAFVDAIWQDIRKVDYRRRLTWLAPGYAQSPQVMRNLLTRQQDPTRLLEAVSRGTPILVLYGDLDKMVHGEHIAKEMEPHCTDMEVYVVRGGGHAPFYEHREEFVRELLQFVGRITTKGKL